MWLHYGMTLICYPIFRSCTTVLGQIGRSKDTVTRKEIKERIAGEYGHLGSLDRSVERIIASLTNWGILEITDSIKHARIHYRSFGASVLELEVWQLACALHAHPSNGIPFDDLVRLPELFPFRFKMGIDSLQHDQRFEIYRQGGGYDLVKGLW